MHFQHILGHVFDGKFYFTITLLMTLLYQGVRSLPIAHPAAKPAPKLAATGKHVQLFKMRRRERERERESIFTSRGLRHEGALSHLLSLVGCMAGCLPRQS